MVHNVIQLGVGLTTSDLPIGDFISMDYFISWDLTEICSNHMSGSIASYLNQMSRSEEISSADRKCFYLRKKSVNIMNVRQDLTEICSNHMSGSITSYLNQMSRSEEISSADRKCFYPRKKSVNIMNVHQDLTEICFNYMSGSIALYLNRVLQSY